MTGLRTSEYQTLLDHMEWADASLWESLSRLEAARGDSRLIAVLYHLHTVQRVYLQMWRGEAIHVPEQGHFDGLSAVLAWARPCYAEIRDFVEKLDPEAMGRTVEFPWAAEVVKRLGSAGPATLGETLLQVVLHSTYHRGQAATRIRELGGEPPLTDLIAWAWRGRPPAPW